MFDGILLRMVLTLLRSLIKNPAKAAKLKSILLDIRDAISDIYPDDTGQPFIQTTRNKRNAST